MIPIRLAKMSRTYAITAYKITIFCFMDNSEKLQIRLRTSFCVLAAMLAFWVVHGLLRFVLLFRDNPYGIPFVAKPDWYIFHAICIDYIWIAEIALPFLLLALFLPATSKARRFVVSAFCVLQGIILPLTLLDHEVQRFLGTHFSLSLLDTYKDASSVSMFFDYVEADQSIPYLQWFLLVGILPAAYFIYRVIYRAFARRGIRMSLLRAWLIGCVCFFGASELFLNVIWKGTNRMRKLAPVVQIFSNDIAKLVKGESQVDPAFLKAATDASRHFWAMLEGRDSLDYEYPYEDFPMYRVPKDLPEVQNETEVDSSAIRESVPAQPNFLVIFLESQRGLDVGYVNPEDARGSVTPVMDSLARAGEAWTRFYAAGVPTVGGVLSSHFGFPTHRFKQTASELAHVDVPSFASILKNNGYLAHFFSAADPAWDNLSVWFQKWYDRTHYDRTYEDDSTFFDVTAKFIADTLALQSAEENKPFIAAMITRSNHYPFNLVPGMPDSEKSKSQPERMRYTMGWADKQLGRFLGKLSKESWFKDTYVIVLGDHGFPQGEHGVSAIGSDAYSSVTLVPFVVNGPGLRSGSLHELAAGQCDIAPTILHLAHIRAANAFMGHNLFREDVRGFAVGAHSGKVAFCLDSLRLLGDAANGGDANLYLYVHDKEEDKPLGRDFDADLKRIRSLADTLLGLNDWILAKNRVQKPLMR